MLHTNVTLHIYYYHHGHGEQGFYSIQIAVWVSSFHCLNISGQTPRSSSTLAMALTLSSSGCSLMSLPIYLGFPPSTCSSPRSQKWTQFPQPSARAALTFERLSSTK